MGQKTPKPMTPFDSLVTPPHLYTLKLLLPYTTPSMQRFFAVYIKFLELRNTMDFFRGFRPTNPSSHVLDELKPYMNPSEQEMMEQMESMMNMMEMVQNMQAMSEDNPQSSFSGSGNLNPLDFMKGMMNPEQQEMFNMYSNIFDNELKRPEEDHQKGESEHE